MYTLLRNNSLPTPKQIEDAFQGNYEACKKPQVKLAYRLDLNLQTVRKFPGKYTQVTEKTKQNKTKQKQFNAEYTECKKERHSTHIELDWVTRQWKTWVDLLANLISAKVSVSYRKSTLVRQVDLHLHASPFGQGFKVRGSLSKSHPLNFA